jgi:8-oxo-dGTP pyrophosphatase MutT (NUDIX family)
VTLLYDDARRVLDRWVPPNDEQAAVLDQFQKLFAEHADPTRRDNPGAHITASALVVSAELDRVLLCLHGRVRRWLQVGGHCEDADVSLAGAALREAVEESSIGGLRADPVPIDLDIHPVECRYGPAYHYDVRFALLAPPGAVPVVSHESLDLAWFAPDELPQPLGLATERLVAPALARFR